MKDQLGDRMKKYEKKFTKHSLDFHDNYIYARVDGRGFSKLTKGADKPFDNNFIDGISETTRIIKKHFNADIAYVQSDEISLGWSKAKLLETQFIFDAKVQKLCSIIAAKTSVVFYKEMTQLTKHGVWWKEQIEKHIPCFDCRIFELPTSVELYNCFEWRYQDAVRNYIQQWARAYCSHKELDNLNKSQIIEYMKTKNRFPSELTLRQRYGMFLDCENKEHNFDEELKFADKIIFFPQ